MTASNVKSRRPNVSGATAKLGTKASRSNAFLVDSTVSSSAKFPFTVPVRTKTLRALSGKADPVTKLIERFGAAVEKSQLMGGPVSFKVDVDTKGIPTFTAIEDITDEAKAVENGQDDLKLALAAARERGRLKVADILSADDMLSADEFAALIGTSRVTVNSRRQNRQVLGLEGAKRGFRFPEWQIGEDGKPFSVLPDLFDRLGDSPWAVYRFLVQHHSELDGLTGVEALRRGKKAETVEAAESVVQAFS